MLRFVVLLKHGTLEFVACDEEDIFRLARLRNAGICGVFDDKLTAEQFIATQQQLLLPPGGRGVRRATGAN